ncbi:MAG: transglutaminase-like domain-containing protein [Pirellulaceae bacterium]|nr:transglutaminase-like domain-containing protein [Pirellulaceae bacterium]
MLALCQLKLVVPGLLATIGLVAMGVGCAPSTGDSESPSLAPAILESQASLPAPVVTTVDIDDAETWDLIRISGQPIGYQVTRWKRTVVQGVEVRQISAESRLKLQRFGQVTEETMSIVSRDSLSGQLQSFATRIASGNNPIVTTGLLLEGQLNLETVGGSQAQTWILPVPNGCGGLFAVESNLLCRPMLPRESRSLTAFVPVVNVVSTVELTALEMEHVQLLGQTEQLLHIVSQTSLASGQSLRADLWCDRAGQILKSEMGALQQETIRVQKQIALSEIKGEFDLGNASIVKIDPPLPSPRKTGQVRYLAKLENENPAAIFAERPYQRIFPIDERRAAIQVTAVRPSTMDSPVEDTRPQDSDRQPSAAIQSRDPLIQKLANQVVPVDDDPWTVSVAIEKFVYDYVTEKNFSTAFATAAEVAKNRSGDCTEHAVLTAAICRARGISARIAIGLVYVPAQSGFAFHMWNEVWVQDRWLPIDATLGRGGIAADHLVLTTSSFDAQQSFASFLPVIQTIGQLTLVVEEVESSP